MFRKEEIAKAPVDNVQDLLEYALGVDLQSRGPHGIQADVSIRGCSFEQTLVLVDGVKMSDPQTGHHLLNIPLALPDIERIEILKGHGSRLYGPNAFGGVINIITRKHSDRSLIFNSIVGDFGLKSGTLSLNYPYLQSSHRLTLSKSRSNGYIEHSEFNAFALSYGSSMITRTGKIDFSFGYQDKEFGANTFYSDQFPNQWEHTQAIFLSSVGHWEVKSILIKPLVYWREHKDNFVLDSDRPDWFRNNHLTDVYGFEFQSGFNSGLGITSFGGEVGQEIIRSSNLGDHERNKGGFFIEHHIELRENLNITAGAFAYSYTNWGWKVYPGLDLGIWINPKLRIFSTIGGSFRVPTYTELYYDSPANKGNRDLRPEKAVSYETGAVFTGNGHRTSISFFNRQGWDIIDWVRASSEDPWIVKNISDLNTYGIEFSVELNPRWYIPSIPLNRVQMNYGYIESDRTIGNYTSKYALSHLRHQILFGLEHDLPFGLQQTWKLRYKERLGNKGHIIMDTRLGRSIKSLELFLAVTNIFDSTYREVASVPMPGRWIKAGFSLNLSNIDG